MKKNVWRAVIELGFIIFLFYSNLLMGEFERSGMGLKRGVAWAIEDVFTAANFEIATIAALIGYILFDFRKEILVKRGGQVRIQRQVKLLLAFGMYFTPQNE
jgi:hypothetical protein